MNPIVSNGQVVEVLVNNVGSGYYSTPDLILEGDGFGAALTPIIENGQITSVKVVSGGTGHNQSTTTLTVSNAGTGFTGDAQIQNWNVDRVKKHFDVISSDDGFIVDSKDGLQFTHLYAPRKLRERVYPINQDGDFSIPKDLGKTGNVENLSTDHSPIIG